MTRRLVLLTGCAVALHAPLAAQTTYREPPAPIGQMLDAPLLPAVRLSPDGTRLLLLERPGLPPIAEVAAPEARLAGIRLNPRTNGPSREATFTGLTLVPIAGGAEVPLALPKGARAAHVLWSADGKQLAFSLATDDGFRPWVADVATGQAHQLADVRLNASLGAPCRWVGVGGPLVCLLVPHTRAAEPAVTDIPSGPAIQEAAGAAKANRTYQDLLRNAGDEARFEFYFTSQPALIALDGTVMPLGKPAIYEPIAPSPDGRFLLVERVHRPFSYQVPVDLFPAATEVWGLDGTLARAIHDRPLQDQLPTSFDAVPVGPRNIEWRDDAPATLVWAEALDGGDPAKAAARRDRVRTLAAPFTGEGDALAELETRFGGVTWGRADLAIVSERWRKTRRTKSWVVDPSHAGAAPRLLFDRSSEDRYADPGAFAMTAAPGGGDRILTTPDGKFAFLTGFGASAEGDRPFVDRIELATAKTTRLWRSTAPFYEEAVAVLDAQGRVLTRRESTTEPPNYWLRETVRRAAPRQLTRFADPAPQFAGVTKELITYKRKDGVDLSGTMYLPAGYDKAKGPLPFFLWAYPQEFKTAAAAAQVIGSPYRFTRPSGPSHLFLLTQGYGILDGPTMPIVGEGDAEPNDTYVAQLVASAQAAVDKLVSLGVADPARVAIGGHSYGAFMTANLLAHSSIFRAGIARSGAYNRTLTPFGFQAEERPYWKAEETYTRMSPFTYADSIKAPILFIHGEADDNSGTFPIQSERMYAAVTGNGGTARLVMLPAEAHGYRGRESVGHTLAEMTEWLDRWLKPQRTAGIP